jgi:hypothetical protein
MALSFAFDAAKGETPDILARRRENADVLAARLFGSAPKNVGEGLNMLGQALILRQMQDENSAAMAAGQASVPDWLKGGGAPGMPAAPMATAPMGNLPSMPQTGIVQNDGNAAPGTVGMNQRLADLAYDFIDDNPGTSLSSGHRSTEDQARLYANRANNPNPVAPPGSSNHERGNAVDIGGMTPGMRQMLPQYGLAQPVRNDPPHVELARPTQLASNDATLPVNAQEAQGYAIPGQPAQRGGSLFPSASTADLAKALSNPWAKQYHGAIETELKMRADADKTTTVDLGNEVGIMRGGQIIRREPKGEPNKAPSFGVIGEDEYGNKRYGWTDSKTRSVTEYEPASGTQPRSTLPPVPAGVDPKKWRDIHSERVTNDSLPADDKATSGLRNEIQGLPSYKNLSQAAPVYKAMSEAASRDNRAADLNLIYGFGKIMDPGSVVRESEMTMAEKINTLPQYLRATAESQLSGSGRLSPEVRAQILQEANGRIQAYKGLYDQDMGMYRGIARDRRMKESHVIPDFGTFEPWQPPKAPVNSNQPIVIDGYTIKAR